MFGKKVIALIEPCYHTKEGHLAKVEKCLGWEAATENPENTFRSGFVELENTLNVLLEVSGH